MIYRAFVKKIIEFWPKNVFKGLPYEDCILRGNVFGH